MTTGPVSGLSAAPSGAGAGAVRSKALRPTRAILTSLSAGRAQNPARLVSPSVEGTPQGGPLSPLLSNIVLDELDRELEHRGHRFVRYADDCNIYVRSKRAGHALNWLRTLPCPYESRAYHIPQR
jgi:Reverse transcriptase (RNA-dependent DNA polymerase)